MTQAGGIAADDAVCNYRGGLGLPRRAHAHNMPPEPSIEVLGAGDPGLFFAVRAWRYRRDLHSTPAE